MIALDLLLVLTWCLCIVAVCGVVAFAIEHWPKRWQIRRLLRRPLRVPPPPRSQHHGIRQYEINQRAYKSMR